MRISDGAFKILYFIMILLIVVGIISIVFSKRAKAHSWYSTYCCTGKDCTKIPTTAVKAGKNGYEIHLTPADHPSLNTDFDYTVPYLKAHKSEDSEFHACILPETPDVMRCLYAPNMGF